MKRSLILLRAGVVLALAFCLSGSLFAAAPKKKVKPPKPVNISKIRPKDTITISVYSGTDSEVAKSHIEKLKNPQVADVLLEKFNVKLDFPQNVRDYSGFILLDSTSQEYADACAQGYLLDFEKDQLIYKWGPLVLENYKRSLQKNRFIDSPDTIMHGFATDGALAATDFFPSIYTWSLPADLYEDLKKPDFKSIFDLVEVLEKMKEASPKNAAGKSVYGASLYSGDNSGKLACITDLIAAYYGYEEFCTGYYDPLTGTMYNCLDADGPYLNILKFLNKLSQKELLNPASQKQSLEQSRADFAAGTVLWSIFDQNQNSIQVVPKEARPLVKGKNVYGGNTVMCVGAGAFSPELCMAILNWYTGETAAKTPEPVPVEEIPASKKKAPKFTVSPVSLYVQPAAPVEYTDKWQKVSTILVKESWNAIFAKDDTEFEKIITDLQSAAKDAGYNDCLSYTAKNASLRYTAEKLARGEK